MAGSIVQIVGPGGASSADTSIVSSSITCTAGNQLWVIAISDDTTISATRSAAARTPTPNAAALLKLQFRGGCTTQRARSPRAAPERLRSASVHLSRIGRYG